MSGDVTSEVERDRRAGRERGLRVAARLMVVVLAGYGLLIPAGPAGAAEGAPPALAASTTSASLPTGLDLATTQSTGWAASPDGTALYLLADGPTRTAPGAVMFVDPATSKVTRTVSVGNAPVDIAIAPDGGRLATTSWKDKAVRIIDARTGKTVKRVPVGGQADAVAFGPRGRALYVFVNDKGLIAKIDLKSYAVTGRYSLKSSTGACRNTYAGLTLTPDGSTLLVSCDEAGLKIMSAVNGRMLGSIDGVGGGDPVLSPDGRLAYWGASVYLSVVDIAARKEVGGANLHAKGDGDIDGIESPLAIVVSEDGAKVYVTMPEVGQVSVVNPRSGAEVSRIALGGKTLIGASGLAGDASRLFVSATPGLVTIDEMSDTVIGVDPVDPPAAAVPTAGPMVLAGSRIAFAWSTFGDPSYPVKGSGITTLTLS